MAAFDLIGSIDVNDMLRVESVVAVRSRDSGTPDGSQIALTAYV